MKLISFYQYVSAISALFVIGKFVTSDEIYRSSCRRRAIFQLVAQNTRLDVSVIETIVAHTLLMCSMKCINDVLCKSINYNVKTRRCEKLSGNRLTDKDSQLIAANSWEHYEREAAKVMYHNYVQYVKQLMKDISLKGSSICQRRLHNISFVLPS